MDDQLLQEFLAEAEDLIELLYADVAALRARRSEGRARRELVGRIFRHVHTVKGSAAAAGLESAGELAHEFETLLDAVRLGRVAVDERVVGVFEEAVTAIASDLSAVSRGLRAGVPSLLVERLRQMAAAGAHAPPGRGAAGAADPVDLLPGDVSRALGEYERHRLREASGEGASVYVVSVDFDLLTFDEQFRALSDALAEAGESVSTLPGVETSAPDLISFRIVYATEEGRERLAARVAPFGATLLEGGRTARGAEAAGAEEPATGEVLPASAASLTMLVRVPLDELDDLISATHELFTDTVGALDLALAGGLQRASQNELEIRAPRVRRRFFELEERLIELRMVPVRATLERASRVGQSVARVAGREVDFEIEGGEVRLDKSLAERIADPLLHLLRNAVDHGVEPPEERRRAGKPPRGRVRLEAVSEGSRVSLRVADDGRGIDPERVARAAAERGLVGPEEHLSDHQALRLIFRPGFSTAPELSSVSGRGVGLDVVEQAVEQAGGELRVWSRKGVGTTFEMRLPTTLALVPSLVVRSSDYRYCVDASHIVEAGYLEAADVEREGDEETARWRGERVPLVHLHALLAQQPRGGPAPADARIPVIISRVGGGEAGVEYEGAGVGEPGEGAEADAGEGRRVAVAVDGWDGHSEVLVRGLGRHATHWRGVSGAAELRDGTVALMLDLPRLLGAQ